jgi:hypothetical protein
MSLYDELDCLSLTSHFSGESPRVKVETSSSSAHPNSSQPLTLLTKMLPRDPRNTTWFWNVLLNSLWMNGSIVPCQSSVPSLLRIVQLTFLSCSILVANSELGIRIAPPLIHPPIVCLIYTVRVWGFNPSIAWTRTRGSVALGVWKCASASWLNVLNRDSTTCSGTK